MLASNGSLVKTSGLFIIGCYFLMIIKVVKGGKSNLIFEKCSLIKLKA